MSINLISTAPVTKTLQPIFKTMTRKQIAAKYGVATKTLNRWLDEAGLKLPSGLLPPSQVERIWEKLGEW